RVVDAELGRDDPPVAARLRKVVGRLQIRRVEAVRRRGDDALSVVVHEMPRMAAWLLRVAPVAKSLVMRARRKRDARRKCQQQEKPRTMGVSHAAWVARRRAKLEKIVYKAEIQPIDQARQTISRLRMQRSAKNGSRSNV